MSVTPQLNKKKKKGEVGLQKLPSEPCPKPWQTSQHSVKLGWPFIIVLSLDEGDGHLYSPIYKSLDARVWYYVIRLSSDESSYWIGMSASSTSGSCGQGSGGMLEHSTMSPIQVKRSKY